MISFCVVYYFRKKKYFNRSGSGCHFFRFLIVMNFSNVIAEILL